MFDPKYAQLIFSSLMALFMSCIMSLAITLYNVGFVDDILGMWLKAWLFAFVVALPVINLVSPVVHRLVRLLVKRPRL
ncbi:DUF2798 domain-containing protein [Vreelandella olivaria]|uniref:DUF2798 domain-containing protein n=1 Tax=Vreelandella olivaria TaxID=390919 RepID=UPI00201F7F3B|nr:DUF2798 domain-containing protein [Halomonas olivaria]